MKIAIIAAVLCTMSCSEEKHDIKKSPARATTAQTPSTPSAPSAPEAPHNPPARTGHPSYPSAKAAGTAAIFSLEEPDRGPLVTEVVLPQQKLMRWSSSAYCELEAHGLTCSKTARKAGADGWKIGSMDRGEVVLAKRYQGKSVVRLVLMTRDKAGELTRLVSLRNDGTVSWASTYSDSGTKLSRRKRSGGNGFGGCGSRRIEFDTNGRTATLTCLQWMGKPMLDSSSVAVTQFVRDDNGFIVEQRFLDTKGKPTARRDRVHKSTTTRDAIGRPIKTQAFDLAGTPTTSESEDGCAQQRTEYNDHGRELAQRCFDANGNATAGTNNVSVWQYRHNKAGCQVGLSLLGITGKPILSTEGIHAIQWGVDRYCRKTRERCLNIARKATPCGPRKAAERRSEWDKDGNKISVRHFDGAGKAGKDYALGAFELRYSYDAQGRRIGRSCFATEGKAIKCGGSGYHRDLRTFDDAGREIEKRYFDVHGEPTTNMGIAVKKSTYNNYDHIHEAVGMAANGTPNDTRGMFKARYVYGAGHRMFGMLLFDVAGEPARYRECYVGMTCPGKPWHAVRIVRSNRGHVLENLFFDRDRKLVGTTDCMSKPCWK